MDMHVQRPDPRGQIKTRQRVRDLAEVYTHEREVNAMLNLIPDMFPAASTRHVDVTFLEPACGSGNFLEEILGESEADTVFAPRKLAEIESDITTLEGEIAELLKGVTA